jgi:alkylated DNA repair dioxygenase AlkB
MPGKDSQAGKARRSALNAVRSTQLDLPLPAPISVAGFLYQRELVSPEQETELVRRLAELEFRNFEFHGYFGRRRVVSFGVRYDFADSKVHAAAEIPPFLLPLRRRAAAFAGIDPAALRHVLVTEYQPGAGIGWHRDRAVFEDVIGVSLLSPCRFRLRRKSGASWQRQAILLEPRSAYLLRGAVREQWEHSIPPAESQRYSVTFRSLRDGGRSPARRQDLHRVS